MVVYAFVCDRCSRREEAVREMGNTRPPHGCNPTGCRWRRDYRSERLSKQIIRPDGYHLHPGEKGYWDFGAANKKNYRPPLQVDDTEFIRKNEEG